MIDYKAIDFDNHLFEPDDCFTRHIEPRFRDGALRVVPSARPGIGRWVLRDKPFRFLVEQIADHHQVPGANEDVFSGKGGYNTTDYFRPKDMPSLIDSPEARCALMDEQGLEAIVLLPTTGLTVVTELAGQPELLTANVRSFNRWLEEEWGFGADGRIFGVPVMTLVDPDFAASEVERLAGLGARFVVMNTGPVSGRSPADPMFDRFWRAVETTGMRVIIHLDASDYAELISSQWSEPPCSKFEMSPLQLFHMALDRPIRDTIAALVLHNLFGRFPDVQIITIELGSDWVSPLLTDLDKIVVRAKGRPMLGGPLPGLPSEILPRHLHTTTYPEDDIATTAAVLGVDRVLFGSDYPHAEGLRVPLSFLDRLGGFSEHDVRRIMRDNGAALLGL